MRRYAKKNIILGGGEEHKTSLFKPLVATSLALALGVSVAVATDPSITYSNNGGSSSSTITSSNNSWQFGNATNSTQNIFQLQDSSNSPIKNLSFVFDKLTDPSNTPTQNIDTSGVKTLTITTNGQVAGNNVILKLSNASTGKGLLLGTGTENGNRGTLTFDFLTQAGADDANWNANANSKRKMILDLSAKTDYTDNGSSKSVSLIGNILIKAGLGAQDTATGPYAPDTGIINTNVFEATLGGDMIGNITISPYDNSENSSGRDIKTTFTFNSGSLTGNITSHAGKNTFNFNGANAGITGDVFADNNYQQDKWHSIGTENGFYGGVNTITFSGSGTHTITGSIKAQEWGQNNIFFTQGNGEILGDIISGDKLFTNNTNQNNTIVFKGTSATIGSDSKASSIIVNNENFVSGQGTGKFSYNAIELNAATSNTLKINEFKIIGDFAFSDPSNKTLNILSFNNENATNTANINSISVTMSGRNIIGKNLYQNSNANNATKGFNSNLFTLETVNAYGGKKVPAIQIKNDFATNFMTSAYTAKGSITIGTNNTQDAITTKSSGNYINMENIDIVGNITATGGSNYIYSTGTLTLGSESNKISIINGENFNSATQIKANVLNANLEKVETKGNWWQTDNDIIIEAQTGNIAINTLNAKDGANHNGTVANDENKITLRNGSLTITTMTSSSRGINLIDSTAHTNTFGTISSNDGGTNKIILKNTSGTNSITGEITANATGGSNILSLTSVSLGENEKDFIIKTTSDHWNSAHNKIEVTDRLNFVGNVKFQAISNSSYGGTFTRLNILKSSGNISGNISEISSALNGTEAGYGYSYRAKNILSFENTSEQNLTIGDINKQETIDANGRYTGYTYIGKGITTGEGNTLALNSSIFSDETWKSSEHQANLNLTITGNIFTNTNANYINVKTFNANTITAGGGANNIVVETGTIRGQISASGGTNNVSFSGANSTNTISGEINASGGRNSLTFSGANSTNTISGQFSTSGGTNNVSFSGASSTNTISGAINAGNGTNNIAFSGSDSNTISNNISVNGDGRNAISFTKSLSIVGSSAIALKAEWGQNNITSSNGSNINIGNETNKVALEVYGYNADKVAQNNISTTGSITAHLSTISSYSANYNNNGYHKNIITGGARSNITITSMSARDHANNINEISVGANSSILVTGDITSNIGKNNFVFTGNASTLTLKGATSQISNLTAYAPSSRSANVSTLVIDGTTQANSTTIDNVINGNNLIAKFNGQGNSNGATLKISGFTGGNTLKAITLGDSSTNNTLDLTALDNTTITDAINVKNGQELNINLKNTTLTTSGWSNAGTSTITVGGASIDSANATLQGGNVTLSTLTLQATNGASMTLQNSSTTIGTLTSSSTSGDKLILGYNSPSITTQTNNVSATITNQVSGSNLTLVFNGGEDRSTSLTLSGADKTFKAIQLGSSGSEQSTHNTLILNNGKTTITDSFSVGNGDSTQALAFTLKDSTELALTAGLTTGTNGITTLRVEDATNGVTLSGGAVQLTNLDMVSSTNSSLTFKNTTTTINTLTSNATDTQINTLIMGDGSSNVTVNNTAKGTKFNLTYNDTTNNGNKTFTLTGGENTIKQVSVSDTATTNTLAVTGGSTTITDAITIASGKNLTLSLSSSTDTQNPSTTLVTLNNTISGAKVSFSGGINPADQIHHSTLWLKGQNNRIASIESSASNGVILFEGTAGAIIDSATITSINSSTPALPDASAPSTFSASTAGGSLTFAFRGEGTSNVTINGSGITVGNGATLGISLGGSGNKTINGSITFEDHSTLLVDFLDGNSANATITANNTTNGQNGANATGITIGANRNSIINFHGTNTGKLNGSGITIDGGTNTINFIGSATMSGVTLSSGTNTINVYGKSSTGKAITGTIVTSQLGNIDNTINLNDYSTLNLLSAENGVIGSGELKTSKTNTLNFLGEGAKLQGGFGADTSNSNQGTATINVGSDSTRTGISGLITGNVSGAGIVFKGTLANDDSSKLTLQGSTNTISSLTTSSNNGILVLDASKNAVNVDVTSAMNIDQDKSITVALHSTKTSNNNATFDVAGNIAVTGTLGIAISGDGTGNRAITTSSGGNITFNSGSTLRVDFLENSAGSASLGGGNSKFVIDTDKKSEINFYAGSTATLAGGGLVLNGGTNTVNFYGNATLGQITLTSGTNNINVKDGVTAKIEDTASSLGSVNNTINLGANSILQLEAGTNTNNGDGSIVTANTNMLNFEGANATLQGGFGVSGNGRAGSATINVKNTGALITGNVTNAGVNFSIVDGSTLTLQGATNTLNALGSTTNITGTVILDASNQANGVSAEITNAVASNSSVGLKFGSGNYAKTFKFSASGNTLSGVEFDESGSTSNKIAFTKGNNTITNAFSITQGQGLTIALGDGTTDSTNTSQISLALTGGFSQEGGSATLRVEGQTTADALISGGEIDVGNLDMVASTSASLTLKNSSVTIDTLTAQNGSNTLKLDATSNAVNTTINNALKGNNLTIALAGANATNTATLNLNGAGNTINALTLTNANNTLILNNGKTTINSAVSVASGQGVGFNLAENTTLNFAQGLSTTGGSTTLSFNGSNTNISGSISTSTSGATTAISLLSGVSGSISGNITNSGTTNTTLDHDSSLKIDRSYQNNGGASTFSLANNTILAFSGGLNTTGGSTTIDLLDGASASISGSISNTNSATTTLKYKGNNATLALKKGNQTISTLTFEANDTTSTLNLSNQAKTTISNALTLDNSKNLNVNIDETSTLNLASVSTTSGALNVNADGSLSGSLTLAGLTNEDQNNTVNNTINVSTFTLNGELNANKGATNTIKANSITLSGNVTSKNQGSATKNTFITNSIEFATSSSVYTGHTGGMATANLFDISERTHFDNDTLAIITNNNYATNGNQKLTLFKFGGEVSGNIAELTSTSNGSENGYDLSKTKSVLSFEGSAPQSLTITDVNKDSTLTASDGNNGAKNYANGKSGYIYIGKNLTSGSGETLDLNSAFNDTNWSDATYQANNLTLTIQNLNTNGGKNYINVGSLSVGNDSGSGSISASDGGVNNIALGKDSRIKGNITSSGNGANNIVIQGSNATLTLEGKDVDGTTHAITTLNAIGENTALVLDNSGVTSGVMTTTINTLNGANLTAILKGKDASNSATLALNGGTLKALTLGEGSAGNILDLSNATDMNIANQVNVGNGQDLTIKLKNTTLALNGGLNTNGGTSTIALEGTDSASATLTGGAIALSNLTLGATDSNKLAISSSSAVIDSITASGSTSNTLALNNTRTTINSALDATSNPLSLEVNNSTLVLGSSTNTITSLTSNGGLVDLSQGVKPQTPYVMARGAVLASNGASARNTLTMQTLEGSATFKLYVSQTESDRVEFSGTQTAPYNADVSVQPTSPSGIAIISVTGGNDVFSITESDNVIVATRADNSVDVVGGESFIGGARVSITIGAKSDDANTFIIKNAIELEADPVYQEVASSALAVNYDLFLANFNSLNKRMGELRNTQESNGVWARVFGGAISNDFGAGSKTQYVTAQAGYDYSLSIGDNARNFIGIALAYGTSDTKGNASYASSSNNAGLSLDKVNSNMVEVGLYNSYVADNGWYNDTIFKFDYIMSEFSLSNNPSTMSSTNNFAMVLSDEFGYRYSFGENEKGSWYIDPQAEFAFGYFNQSDFNRAVDSLININASQDAILTLRSRIGATLGKKFNTEKGFASLYVGASYEYDYIEGGDSGISTRDGGLITQLDKVESNGRAVLNVGSNIELTKGARLYIDVEKSFGDKQRTFMQFNLGARYSF